MSGGARHLLVALLLLAPRPATARPGLYLQQVDLSEVRVLTLHANYFGSDGRFVAGASADRFSLLIHGEEHPLDEVIPFDQSKRPIYLVVVPQLDGIDAGMRAQEAEAIRRLAQAAGVLPDAMMGVVGVTRGTLFVQDLRPAFGFEPDLPPAEPGSEAAEPYLLDGVRAAIDRLNAPGAGSNERKLIVVLTDGRNPSMERRDFTSLGKKALLANIAIDTVKLPTGHAGAGPLDELVKQCNGRAVEARDGDDLGAWIDDLAVEVRKQYVLRYRPTVAQGEIDVQLVTNDARRTYSNNYTRYIYDRSSLVEPIPFWGRPAIWQAHPFWYVTSMTFLLLACAQMVVVISRRRRRPD